MSFTHAGRTIQKVAVIGSGQIGPDIALYFTKVLSPHDVSIVVVDVAEDALERGEKKLKKKIQKGVDTGAFSHDQQRSMESHVTFTSDYEQVRGADFVLEAATEDQGLKQRIFGQVEELVAPDAILASNSSHLEPEVIFEASALKDRTTVIHYFFPAERNMLVEVVPSEHTDPAIASWLMSFYEAIGKAPIRVRSRYGYAIDPVFEGLFLASALLAESGVATTKQIDTVATQGARARYRFVHRDEPHRWQSDHERRPRQLHVEDQLLVSLAPNPEGSRRRRLSVGDTGARREDRRAGRCAPADHRRSPRGVLRHLR